MAVEATETTIRIFGFDDGKRPFSDWLLSLDRKASQRIEARLARVRRGNFGDCTDLCGGLFELRMTFGPGYRVYFVREGKAVVIILAGGAKGTQTRDIKRAREYHRLYLEGRENG